MSIYFYKTMKQILFFFILLNSIMSGKQKNRNPYGDKPAPIFKCQTVDQFVTQLNKTYSSDVTLSEVNCTHQEKFLTSKPKKGQYSSKTLFEVSFRNCKVHFDLPSNRRDIHECMGKCMELFKDCIHEQNPKNDSQNSTDNNQPLGRKNNIGKKSTGNKKANLDSDWHESAWTESEEELNPSGGLKKGEHPKDKVIIPHQPSH